MNKRHDVIAWGVLVLALMFPALSWAQAGNSGIAGVVRDTSGAVLPGVSVEATSPVLIEKVRSVVTDSEGAYRILDLRPGAYVVTFTLPGFSTVRREGIELPASFTATVNADLAVGSVEETITVTGAAPLVDVQNVTSQRVMSSELRESLPAARSPQGFAALQPGITAQGLGGIPGGREEMNTAVHGAPTGESMFLIDGINTAEAQTAGGGGGNVFRISQAYVQEINIVVGGGVAEQPFGGTVTNVIPKEGGNTLSGSVYGEYSGKGLAAANLTDELIAQGFTKNSLSNLERLWDFQPALGGRILRDKLWFFGSYKKGGTIQTRAGLFESVDQYAWKYEPDLSKPALNRLTDDSMNLRLTYQATPRNKISVFGDIQPHIVWQRGYQFAIPSEGTAYTPYLPNAIFMGWWKSPVTTRLLLEVSGAHDAIDYDQRRQTPDHCHCDIQPVGYDIIGANDSTTSTLIRSVTSLTGGGGQDYGSNRNQSWRFGSSASYVTGSHAVKVGTTFWTGWELFGREPNGSIAYTMRNWIPTTITQYASQIRWENVVRGDLGIYAQDQWTMKRLTLTGGARFDYYQAGAREQHLDAGLWVGARDFPATKNSPLWKDVAPRIAASYDLFGDGRTAIKGSLGKFVAAGGAGSGGINANHPVVRSVLSVTRSWADANTNFNPDCDLKSPLANGECGQISDLNFGQNNPRATVYDAELLTGLRSTNWETTAVVQRQLATGISVTFGYYRRNFSNFTVTDNTLVAPSDYNTYCVTAPTDSRLPGGGGNQLCGYADVVPALFGRNQSIVRSSSHYGDQVQTYDGFDLTESIRLRNGATIQGGLNWGRTKTNNCYVVDSPATQANKADFCDVTPPMQPSATFVGFVPLPLWGLLTSATFRDYGGQQITATRTYTNAEILPSLGRNLSNGANGTVNLAIVKPGTMYAGRQRQLDIRISKRLRFTGTKRASLNFDVFNIFNASGVNTLNNTYGPNWQRALLLQQGRYIKLNAQFDF
jgi:hypothetical protein